MFVVLRAAPVILTIAALDDDSLAPGDTGITDTQIDTADAHDPAAEPGRGTEAQDALSERRKRPSAYFGPPLPHAGD